MLRSLVHTTRVAARTAMCAAFLAVAACGDSPTAPKSMDAAAVERVIPSLIDARQRLVPRLVNASLRPVFAQELARLQAALDQNNVHQANLSIDVVADALTGAVARASTEDAADLTAIELMLYAVALVVDAARAEIRFKASP
jgi:hypothetical protein